ncbi:TIGR02302 family protein [Segnochrobactraceae bacterium EtOH-i3]
MTPPAPAPRGPDALDRRIARALARARRALLIERLWPPLAAIAGIAALFVAVSWLGLWLVVPDWARLILLTLFGIAFLAPLIPLVRTPLPGRAEALARVERETGGAHRPVTGYGDGLAAGDADPVARALWAVHRQRLADSLERVSAGLPRPETWRHDPFAVRVVIGLLVVIGYGVASGDHLGRLKSAFRSALPGPEQGLRVDAWVAPPGYTGRTPIVLTGTGAPETDPRTSRVYQVPEGSEVIVRVQGREIPVSIRRDGEDFQPIPEKTAAAEPRSAKAPPAAREHRTELDRGAIVALGRPDDPIAVWRFSVDPDRAPTVRFVEPPKASSAGALELLYALDDDYGAVSGMAEIGQPKPATGALPRPLIPAPEVPLALPVGRAPKPEGERTVRDLTAHPWAGAPVTVTLSVKDQPGQEGRSATVETVLPARTFARPVARALIEQRRELALDADAQLRVLDALDAIQLAMEGMDGNAGAYLGVHDVYRRLAAARTDAELVPLVDDLWTLALMIEDGNLSEAAKALRDAQEALRRALENGASPEEIARLTQNLREAMNRYLQEMTQQAARSPDSRPMDPSTRMLTQNDLDAMLKRIEELARSGSKEAAQEMLSQLQRMLENLQAGRSQQSPGQSEMNKALDELGRMIQQQQKLMDDTFRADRQRQNGQGRPNDPGAPGQPGTDGQPMSPEEMAEALRQLQEGQGALADQLQQLLKKLDQAGSDSGSALGEAGRSMGEAGQALGRGQPGDAVGSQGQALDQLRRGADQLAREQNGEGQPGDGPGNPGAARATDPLGRPQNADNTDNTTVRGVPEEFDLQRARRVFEELRKRLGEQQRPRQERDYLERLLPDNN